MQKVIIVATYYQDSGILLPSLLAQTNPNWELHVLSNGDEGVWDVPQINHNSVSVWMYENSGYWGAKNRQEWIRKWKSNGSLIVNTSMENYYVPKFVDMVLNAPEGDVIYWDCIHHYSNYDSRLLCQVEARKNSIDWGSFAAKDSVLKSHTINAESITADGELVEEFNKAKYPFVKIPKVLFVKN